MRFLFFLGWILFCGCDFGKAPVVDDQQLKADLVVMNREKQQIEFDSLQSFVHHRQWKMEKTSTGMYYEIVKTKGGIQIEKGNLVSLFYKIYLLDGSLCYDNSLTHPIRFKVGEDHVESGLHQLMPLLRVGDEVRVVMPSYLAFGFSGDGNKIPGDAPLYYEIKVVTVQ
jgi:FKBP-type peptidyl-prolyl cis-trans isomerase FkpA